MAKHEFGIMDTDPAAGKRYDEYEPAKYNCISVDDEYIEVICPELSHLPCCWHTLDLPGNGLAYCGITLIPPESIGEFSAVIEGNEDLRELKDLLHKARSENKYVIHFGL